MNTKLVILIVTPPGDLQIGLQALLTTHLDVDVLVTGGESSALKVIETQKPALVILDNNLPRNTVPMIIQNIKSNYSDIDYIVMVNDDAGRKKMLKIGVDLIVVKGFPAAKLIALIEKLLSQKGNTNHIEIDTQNESQTNSEGDAYKD